MFILGQTLSCSRVPALCCLNRGAAFVPMALSVTGAYHRKLSFFLSDGRIKTAQRRAIHDDLPSGLTDKLRLTIFEQWFKYYSENNNCVPAQPVRKYWKSPEIRHSGAAPSRRNRNVSIPGKLYTWNSHRLLHERIVQMNTLQCTAVKQLKVIFGNRYITDLQMRLNDSIVYSTASLPASWKGPGGSLQLSNVITNKSI